MIENKDGSFGEIKEAKELLENLVAESPELLEKIKSIHLGTQEELEEIMAEKQKNTLEHRVDMLERKVNRVMIHLGIDDKSEVLKI